MVTPGEGCPGHLISPYLSQNTKNLIAALHSTPRIHGQSWTDTETSLVDRFASKARFFLAGRAA
jgi:hypothetical protein